MALTLTLHLKITPKRKASDETAIMALRAEIESHAFKLGLEPRLDSSLVLDSMSRRSVLITLLIVTPHPSTSLESSRSPTDSRMLSPAVALEELLEAWPRRRAHEVYASIWMS